MRGAHPRQAPEQSSGIGCNLGTPDGVLVGGRRYHHRPLTIWVNAATYLPVRSVAAGLGAQPLVSEFTWLAPTAANLAILTPRIPAGFTYRAPH
jgi:hypothetical protein